MLTKALCFWVQWKLVHLLTLIKPIVYEIILGWCMSSSPPNSPSVFSLFLSYLQKRRPPSPSTRSEALCGFLKLWNPRAERSHCSASLWTARWRRRRRRRGWQEIRITNTHALSLSFLLLDLSNARSLSLSLWTSLCRFGHEQQEDFAKVQKRPCLVWKSRRVSDSKFPLSVSPSGLWL